MVTLKPGEAIKRSWDINLIFDFKTPQEYTLDAAFYLIWFQEEETVYKLENGFSHAITSDMAPVTVVEVESFISRKLWTEYHVDLKDPEDGHGHTHYIGTYYYPCTEAQADTIK